MTLVIVADESDLDDAMAAARSAVAGAPVAHPRRRPRRPARRAPGSTPRSASAPASSGERALIRLSGEVTKHAESVVLPLLLPDSPVVVWWPGKAPDDPATDPLGTLGTAPDHRRGLGADQQGQGDADPVPQLRAGQHRPRLDPDHRLAGAAGRGPRPAPGQGHCRRRSRPSGSAPARTCCRLARRPAAGATVDPEQLRGPRHHRGGAEHQAGRRHDLPLRRPARDALLARRSRTGRSR